MRVALAKSIAEGRDLPASVPGPESSVADAVILEAVNFDTSGELGLVLVMSTARPFAVEDAGIFKPADFGAITGAPDPGPLLLPPIAS